MFSTISQLGKTFADELNRINDEVKNNSNGQQQQLTDPVTAKKIIETKTPDIDDIEKPEDMQRDSASSDEQSGSASKTEKSPLDLGEEGGEDKSKTAIKASTSTSATSELETGKSPSQLNTSDLLPGTNILLAELSPEIRSRLIKYVKYEKKYPALYNAYKIEKKKTALIKAFETVLQETTPCSSIGELNAFRDYLKSLDSKSELLNSELSKLTKEKGKTEEEVKTLKQKIKDLQKLATTRNEEGQSEISKLKEDLRKTEQISSENVNLKDQVQKLTELNSSLKEQVKIAENSFKNNKVVITLEEDNKKLKEEISSLQSQNSQLANDLTEHEKKTGSEILLVQKTLEEKESEIAKLQKAVESSQKLNKSFKEKLEQLSKDSEGKSESANKLNTKSPKKKKNKGKNGSNKADDVPENSKTTEILTPEEDLACENAAATSNSEIELVELKHKYSELEDNLKETECKVKSLESLVSQKSTEIEELKDMLRDVGDSLVESQKENKEVKDLEKELNSKSEQLEFKLAELEMLRLQNSKAVADYERTKTSLLKKAEDQSQKYLNVHSKLEKCERERDAAMEKNTDIQTKCTELENTLAKYKTSEKNYQEQIKNISEEKNKVIVELSALQKQASSYTATSKELEKLRVEISRKERFLTEAESRVKFLEEEKGKLNDSLIELKVQSKELKAKHTESEEAKLKITNKNEKLKSENNEYSLRLNKLSLENTRLTKELDELKDQFNEVKHIKLSSSDQVEILKKRVDELLMRNKEYESKNHVIQEELLVSRSMLQERIQEMTTMRKLLNENQESQKQDRKELNMKLNQLKDEKEQSEKEYILSLKAKQKDVDDLKRKCNALDERNEELENTVQMLKAEMKKRTKEEEDLSNVEKSDTYKNLSRSGSSVEVGDYNNKMIDSLRDSLTKNEGRLREMEEINTKLRAANNDASEKMIRLNKKYKLLSQQYKKKFADSSASSSRKGSFAMNLSRNNSISASNENAGEPEISDEVLNLDIADKTSTNSEEDVKEKSIYIKNVLLGFLEHKEQRQMLLPVIKMLLYMTDDDAKKLSELLTN